MCPLTLTFFIDLYTLWVRGQLTLNFLSDFYSEIKTKNVMKPAYKAALINCMTHPTTPGKGASLSVMCVRHLRTWRTPCVWKWPTILCLWRTKIKIFDGPFWHTIGVCTSFTTKTMDNWRTYLGYLDGPKLYFDAPLCHIFPGHDAPLTHHSRGS